MTEFDIGFLMGLVVGEGCFSGGGSWGPCLVIVLHERDPEPLIRVQRLLGGKIYGPYQHNGRHFRRYVLRGSALRSAIPLFEWRLPPSYKRTQFEDWEIEWWWQLIGRWKPWD